MPPEAKKLKVLLIAYQCASESGSVSMIGYRWVKHLMGKVDLHLVSHVRNQHNLDPLLAGKLPITYIDTEWFARPLFRLTKTFFRRAQHIHFMISQLDFLIFEISARYKLSRLHQREQFDICHLVTPVSPVSPHHFGKVGPPMFVGPVNGGMPGFKGFPEIAATEKSWLYPLSKVAHLAMRLRGTYRHVDLIWSAGKQTDLFLGAKLAPKTRHLCENGVESTLDHVPPFPPMPPEGPLKLIFLGRLVAFKGLHLLLKALKDLPNIELIIAGTGPEQRHLEEQVHTLALQERVTFLGQIPHDRVNDLYPTCHLHILPSVRESGGATILEAMAVGRPSLALDHGGPSEYITPECGVLIPCENAQQVINDLKTSLQNILDNPSQLQAMAEAGLTRVNTYFTWKAKIEVAIAAYQEFAK